MRRIAGPELVAEVSNAGGLGILAGLGLPADELRKQIRRVRELTGRPFGVNLWLHEQLQPPREPSQVPADQVRAVQTTLNSFRSELGLPSTLEPPRPFPDVIAAAIDVIIDERVPLWSIGLGNPDPAIVDRCHASGILVMAMICTVKDARAVSAAGVDFIVAQGMEAGGHRSTWVKPASPAEASIGTMTLVPQVVDAVPQPVIAAGGLADGRGLAASLALGAAGILLGTRFVATKESMAPEMYKQALLRSSGADTTVTEAFSGLYARALRNRFTDEYERAGAPVLPSLLQSNAAEDVFAGAVAAGNPDYFPLWSGQSVGLVADLPAAGDVVRAIAADAEAILSRLR